jgi:hypothetical protein
MKLASLFAPDHERYDGVRPIQVHLLRLFYVLMPVFVGTAAWRSIVTHEGPWDPVRAVAVCVWAAYPTLSILGILHPIRMLPLFLFMLAYKVIWIGAVAYPLWRAGALWGTPAGDITTDFFGLPLAIVAVPWGYVFRTYVLPPKASRAATR